MKLHPKLFTSPELVAIRDGFGAGLLELGAKNPAIVAVSADVSESTRVLPFAQKYPTRFFEVGVAEQNMAGVGAGLAAVGKIPFIASYAAFSPGRNWDQIRVSIAYSKLPVKIVGGHAGLLTGADGATHQALEDVALMRALPNMTVLVPCDAAEARLATLAAAAHPGPVYIRTARGLTPQIISGNKFAIGKAQVVRRGRDLTIIACGPILYEALLAAKKLAKRDIEVEVINCPTIKPLDAKTILTSAAKTGRVITAEEHQIHGGLFSAVAELLSQKLPTPILPVAVADTFGESGRPADLITKYHLRAADILLAAKKLGC